MHGYAWPYCPIQTRLIRRGTQRVREYRPPPCYHDCGSDPGTGLPARQQVTRGCVTSNKAPGCGCPYRKCHPVGQRIIPRSCCPKLSNTITQKGLVFERPIAFPARPVVSSTSLEEIAQASQGKSAAAESKQARLVAMLRSPSGATLAAMMEATGWQQHSVRGFLAGVVRKRLKLKLSSKKVDGARVYRVVRLAVSSGSLQPCLSRACRNSRKDWP